MNGGFFYCFLYCLCAVIFRFWHPFFSVKGRENIERGKQYIICANHPGMADPIWMLLALRLGRFPRIMAKAELMEIPVLGAFLRKCNVFGVHRGEHDVTAIKTALQALRDGESLLLYPEGTRVIALPDGSRIRALDGKPAQGKTGAAMFALRGNVPILPVYVSENRHPFSPVRVVIGKPYALPQEDRKASPETLRRYTDELMEKIYALGAKS